SDFMYVVFFILFFFSSRRRHTRFSRDWSSDVCSSDLSVHSFSMALIVGIIVGTFSSVYVASALSLSLGISAKDLLPPEKDSKLRSEERRVGKDGSSRSTHEQYTVE